MCVFSFSKQLLGALKLVISHEGVLFLAFLVINLFLSHPVYLMIKTLLNIPLMLLHYISCFLYSLFTLSRVMNGINAPKVIECKGSDGRLYKQLAKSGNDDLRQDAVRSTP